MTAFHSTYWPTWFFRLLLFVSLFQRYYNFVVFFTHFHIQRNLRISGICAHFTTASFSATTGTNLFQLPTFLYAFLALRNTVLSNFQSYFIHCFSSHNKITVRYVDWIHLVQKSEQYVVGSKSFRPDIQKPRQMENAVRDI